MTRQTLHDAGITLKFEDPSPVGKIKALIGLCAAACIISTVFALVAPAGCL